jgi:hypothetical protein
VLVLWAREVPDDFDGSILGICGGGFLLQGRECAKELVGDVGQDGGAPGRDAVLREKEQEAGEEIVNRGSGGEFAETIGEAGGEVGGLAEIFGEFGVAETE